MNQRQPETHLQQLVYLEFISRAPSDKIMPTLHSIKNPLTCTRSNKPLHWQPAPRTTSSTTQPAAEELKKYCEKLKEWNTVNYITARVILGASLSKADFLVAIEEPFRLTFTPERIKKSCELVGLPPYNLGAITPAMMAPSKVTSLHAPLHINESSPIKRLKAALSDALELDMPAPPLLPLTTPHTPVATSLTPEPEIDHHLDTYTMTSGSSGSASNTRHLLSSTHVHWLASNEAITSADHFDIFTTPPDSSLLPPPVPNNPANPAAEPDFTH